MSIDSPRTTRSKPTSIPGPLGLHLSASAAGDIAGIAAYLDAGAALVDTPALQVLQNLRVPLRAKIAQLEEGTNLRRRLEVLSTYCDDASREGCGGTQVHREAAFALFYYLKGFDRIPDTVPEIGLLDDAMIVQIVLQRHSATLRAHWLHRGWAWPAKE